MEVGLNQDLNNNTTYKVHFKNDEHMVLEEYQLQPLIRMFFNDYISENDLNIINYFLKFEKDTDQHILYFDTLDNTDHISLKQIVDYIVNRANEYSNNSSQFGNLDLRFIKAYTNQKSAEEYREEEKEKDNNFIGDLLNQSGIERIEKIMYITAALYLLSIIKDISDN